MAEIVIVTRHPGAVEFLQRHNIQGRVCESLAGEDISRLEPHSVVVGVLPLHLAVQVLQAGHRFFSLQLHLERWQRGKEISAEDMEGIASLMELQLQWRRAGDPWSADCSECYTGSPEPSAGDMQQFRIGLVPRTAADIVAHMQAVENKCFPHALHAAAYMPRDV